MFVSLSGLFILKLENGIKSGETNPSTHDHVKFYVTNTCLVHGQSGSAAHNITCSVQPSDVLPQIVPPGMQDLISRVLGKGKNRLLTCFLLSTMSIIASVPIIFIFKLSTIRKQCIVLSVCSLITLIFLILATTIISHCLHKS
ncbi:uncharacterized protein EAF02_002097 [Botrytis sinoallii]|uniref:uncharacterized protein n=1 Tax=Botrytis sinoallii TaxID=1463999 RepID=UPI0019025A9A|nr:uncharacterized protein EAF02_002097 [Botrytis sinoallii]KAF7889682.1 hypothetical protein EAF02_002097 [Botrytis sinoallii]